MPIFGRKNKNYTFRYHFVSDKIQALTGESSYTFSMYKLTYEEDFIIKSPKRVESTIELTTNGKTIDTFYIYKQ